MLNNPSTRSTAELRPDVNIDTAAVLDRAVVELADRRFMRTLDAPTQLHLLASLIAQAETWVGEQVVIARQDSASWAEIGRLLGTTATAARQRWASTNPRRRPPASFETEPRP
jgi:hypothetical protein